MAQASTSFGWTCKRSICGITGLVLAVLLLLEIPKWEMHIRGEGVELIRRGASHQWTPSPSGAELGQPGQDSTLVPKAPTMRRKYSLPWKRATHKPRASLFFHQGIRSSRVLEEAEGEYKSKLGLENGTLTWSTEAENFLLQQILESQFPDDCGATRWLVVDPHRHGLGSSVHTYVLTLLMSLSLNRTLVINEAPIDPSQESCIPASIATLLEPQSSCSFTSNPEKRAAFELPEAALDWRQVLHGEEDLDALDVIRLTDTVPRPRGWSWEHWELWQAEGWWESLWTHLVQSGMVSVVGDEPLSEVSMQTQQMMLWANAVNWMWRPIERVQRIARAILCKYKAEEPLVAVHIRRTDKEVEDSYWREHHEYRPLEHYGTAVSDWAQATGSTVKSLLVFSDSAELMQELPKTGPSMLGIADGGVELMYDDFVDLRAIEENWSHERLGCEQKNQIVEHLVAAMEIALEKGEYIVMTMGSSVGRIMAEVLAARRRTANPQPTSPFSISLDVDWFYDW